MQHFNYLRLKILSLVFAIFCAVASLTRNLVPCGIFHQSQWPLESPFSCRWQFSFLHRPRQAQFFPLLHNLSIFTRFSKISRRLQKSQVLICCHSEVCMCLGWSNQNARCPLRHLACDYGYLWSRFSLSFVFAIILPVLGELVVLSHWAPSAPFCFLVRERYDIKICACDFILPPSS